MQISKDANRVILECNQRLLRPSFVYGLNEISSLYICDKRNIKGILEMEEIAEITG